MLQPTNREKRGLWKKKQSKIYLGEKMKFTKKKKEKQKENKTNKKRDTEGRARFLNTLLKSSWAPKSHRRYKSECLYGKYGMYGEYWGHFDYCDSITICIAVVGVRLR